MRGLRSSQQANAESIRRSIYTELADQYKRMSPLSKKRGVLAEHLKEVIDTMEHKVGGTIILDLAVADQTLINRPAKWHA